MLLAILATAPILTGGAEYKAALARAEKYETETAASEYRTKTFYPAIGQSLREVLNRCVKDAAAEPFTLVVSLNADGAVDGVFVERATEHSGCVAAGLAELSAPKPPHPDFAEEMHFVFKP